MDDAGVQVPRRELRPRQGADQGRPGEARRRMGPLSGRRRRRRALPHSSRNGSSRGWLLHAGFRPRRERALHGGRRRLCAEHGPPRQKARDRPPRAAGPGGRRGRPRGGRGRVRVDPRGCHRGAQLDRRRLPARPRAPSVGRCGALHRQPQARVCGRAEPRRSALRPRPAGAAPRAGRPCPFNPALQRAADPRCCDHRSLEGQRGGAGMSVTTNRVGLPRDAYKGAATTLCAGCGHNSITNHMIKALYELGVEPHLLAKMSGIGCSSKTPAYFVETAHGFNGVHGRMPSLTTGAQLANRQLIMLGVSGDGDTASIGLGQFMHMIRRNIDCTYIIEDNGTYGLTKGQFSATADLGSVQKKGQVNTFQPIDPCAVALALGCSFVARSFSGDGKQVVPLIKAALAHRGTAVLDIISPCVTFNDHDGSTKSYSWVKDHEESIADVSFIPFFEEVHVDYEPGTVRDVQLHDGSHIVLKKLGEDHDPTDRQAAIRVLEEGRAAGHLVTGLLYVDTSMQDFASTEHIPQRPLKDLGEDELRMTRDQFAQFMSEFA